jgi:hypothetical protein
MADPPTPAPPISRASLETSARSSVTTARTRRASRQPGFPDGKPGPPGMPRPTSSLAGRRPLPAPNHGLLQTLNKLEQESETRAFELINLRVRVAETVYCTSQCRPSLTIYPQQGSDKTATSGQNQSGTCAFHRTFSRFSAGQLSACCLRAPSLASQLCQQLCSLVSHCATCYTSTSHCRAPSVVDLRRSSEKAELQGKNNHSLGHMCISSPNFQQVVSGYLLAPSLVSQLRQQI